MCAWCGRSLAQVMSLCYERVEYTGFKLALARALQASGVYKYICGERKWSAHRRREYIERKRERVLWRGNKSTVGPARRAGKDCPGISFAELNTPPCAALLFELARSRSSSARTRRAVHYTTAIAAARRRAAIITTILLRKSRLDQEHS